MGFRGKAVWRKKRKVFYSDQWVVTWDFQTHLLGIPRCRSVQIRTSHIRMFDVETLTASEAGGGGRFFKNAVCVAVHTHMRNRMYSIFVIPLCGLRPRVFF